MGHLLDAENNQASNIDPFIAIFLDGKYQSEDLVYIKNKINKFCDLKSIDIKLESSPRLLALWNRPKLVWRIIHNKQRKSVLIHNDEIKKLEEFINTLSKIKKNAKVGLIVSKNIDHALHPTNNIKIETTEFSDANEKLNACTKKFNLDKVPFSIIFKN